MQSPIAAQIWEIWSRRRTAIWLVIGITAFACLFNSVLPDSVRAAEQGRVIFEFLYFHLVAAVVLLLLAVFSYTEVNPQNGSTGFPQRLFVLPVTSLQLVAVPMLLGVAATAIVALAWTTFAASSDGQSLWIAFLLTVYMVLFQTILWTMPRMGSMRMLALGLTGVALIMLPIFPFMRRLSNTTFIGSVTALALVAFLTSWAYVARQRSGGVLNLSFVKNPLLALERLPRRDRIFSSAQAAQFWFEWRRSGLVLPLLVASLLAIIVGPLSWYMRNDGTDSLRILVATLMMPLILALALGKAFSRPDFWSSDLSFPGFIAVRPLSTVDMVAIKMKVAAASTVISWFLVLAFLALWLPFWANLDSIAMIRGVLWQIHGHSVYPQYAIAILGIVAGMFLTWRFLIGGLWLGLSGNNRVFALSAVPYVLVPLLGIPALLVGIVFRQSLLDWIHDKVGPLTPLLAWFAAAAVIAKLWMAAYSWRGIPVQHVRRYLSIWIAGTACLIAFSISVSNVLVSLLPSDPHRLRSLLILLAVLVIPLARIGLAPAFLSRNRHG